MQSMNGTQSLNIITLNILLFLSSNHLTASSSPAPVIVIVAPASMYALL